MEIYQLLGAFLGLAALCAYLNERWFGLPNTIGIMLIGMVLSLLGLAVAWVFPDAGNPLRDLISAIDFDETVLQGMLSFLLFAGALHVNINDLFKQKWLVLILATIGVLVSTFLVAMAVYGLTAWVGIHLPFSYCLVFGALISPTDPIAVLGILKKVGVPKELETMFTGESLFNDGVAVVIFLVVAGLATGSEPFSLSHASVLFVEEAVGGVLFGLALGTLGYYLLKTIDNYHVEVLISLALVAGGYALATKLHVSGPIAVVVAGLMSGNQGRRLAMSDLTRRRLDDFWELVDEILNALLFVLIGAELIVLTLEGEYILAGLLAIPIVLAIRYIAVGMPIALLKRFRSFPPHTAGLLTWGGLRGGISVALALSLPASAEREAIVVMTYVIVVFSILVQGLTIGSLVRRSQTPLPESVKDSPV